jgi:putative AdoMet-dependent methyltransferase
MDMLPSPSDPFPAGEFDGWADTYDDSITGIQFPFLGYQSVLDKAFTQAEARPGMRLLDLGTGTGNLASRFTGSGCELWCTDFSERMLENAREKIPSAHFVLHDLRSPLPPELEGRFDRIVSAYVFHHFELEEKIRILEGLRQRLAPGGRMVIADIAFPDQAALDQVKASAGSEWEEEYYWIAEAAIPALEMAGFKVEYQQISACAGIFLIRG